MCLQRKHPPCDPAPASFGYYDGRFTDGPTGADYLSAAISGGNAIESTLGGDNYAFGGATSTGGAIPSLVTQVGSFLTDVGGLADPNALYLINIGGNDVRAQVAAVAGATATLTDQQVIDIMINSVNTQIGALQAAGAQYFLVDGVGDVGSVPETAAFGPAAQIHGRALSIDMTSQLFAALDPSIFTLDVLVLFDLVKLDPSAFGLPAGMNTTGSCLNNGTPPACSTYAFFDSVHPTSGLHQVLGNAMIAAIPEPGTAMLFGLGLIGLAHRRRAA